jgi:hypothetical protein
MAPGMRSARSPLPASPHVVGPPANSGGIAVEGLRPLWGGGPAAGHRPAAEHWLRLAMPTVRDKESYAFDSSLCPDPEWEHGYLSQGFVDAAQEDFAGAGIDRRSACDWRSFLPRRPPSGRRRIRSG